MNFLSLAIKNVVINETSLDKEKNEYLKQL